jgi:hypothetical protein
VGFADDIIALGSQASGVVSGLVSVVRKVGPVLSTVRVIIDDPAFPAVVTRIRTLHELEAAQAAPATPGRVPTSRVGVGLHRVVPVLDAVIFARRNPWAPWVAGASLLLLIGGVGYGLGRRRRS